MAGVLSKEQVDTYREQGYLTGLPAVFGPQEMAQLNEELLELVQLLEPGEQMLHIRDWHMKSRWVYDIAANPRILDYVESLLGPNFYMWGTQFFAKAPRTSDTVAWHQDAYYWPEHLHQSVTVWLAFTDVSEENGAMQVIPRSHDKGIIKHRKVDGDSVLKLELEHGTFNENEAQSLCLKVGEVSLHSDKIVHGSPANGSDRWRNGLTIRYSGTAPKETSTYEAFMMRGKPMVRQAEVPLSKYGRLPIDYHMEGHVVNPKK